MTTPINGLPQLSEAQNQKYLTINDSLGRLDALVNMTVFNKTRTAPPGNPSQGDRYIVPSGASGDWTGKDGQVAVFLGSFWVFMVPSQGWRVFDQGADQILVYDGASWLDLGSFISKSLASSGNGASVGVLQDEELISLGDTTRSSISFPNKSIPLFASVYVVSEVTGVDQLSWSLSSGTSFETGFSGNTQAGQQMSGPADPVKAVFSDQSVEFAGSPTGGQVRLSISYFSGNAASS